MDQERRQFFRIDHPVLIEYRTINDEVNDLPNADQFEVSPHFHLQAELAEIDSETSSLLARLRGQDSTIVDLFKLLNRKVDAIASSLSNGPGHLHGAAPQLVNLSQGGISFVTQHHFKPNELMAIKLVFPSNQLGLLLKGRVIRSWDEDDHIQTAIEFERMPERYRTLLARCVFEADARRRSLESRE